MSHHGKRYRQARAPIDREHAYTPFEAVTAGEIRARAEVMEVPAETIDGMSVWTVRDLARRAIDHARSGGGFWTEMLVHVPAPERDRDQSSFPCPNCTRPPKRSIRS